MFSKIEKTEDSELYIITVAFATIGLYDGNLKLEIVFIIKHFRKSQKTILIFL